MTFDKEFKEALSHLPSKTKDKLLLRLLKRDQILASRLYFELVEDQSIEDKRKKVEAYLTDRITANARYVYKPGYVMMDLRELSGAITEHVKITGDKFGEISLSLLSIIETLESRNEAIAKQTVFTTGKLCVYMIAKAFRILILISKMHEDIRMEFEEDLLKLGKLFSTNKNIIKVADYNGFDVNWLLDTAIPDDIEAIHKSLRANGFLKTTSY